MHVRQGLIGKIAHPHRRGERCVAGHQHSPHSRRGADNHRHFLRPGQHCRARQARERNVAPELTCTPRHATPRSGKPTGEPKRVAGGARTVTGSRWRGRANRTPHNTLHTPRNPPNTLHTPRNPHTQHNTHQTNPITHVHTTYTPHTIRTMHTIHTTPHNKHTLHTPHRTASTHYTHLQGLQW
jgi:hypothetical protein